MAEQGSPTWSRFEGTLMSAARAVRRGYDLAFSEIGIGLPEASLLATLAEVGAVPQVELARRIGTSRARVGVWIDALAEKGAVERRHDPADRRVWLVALTPAGHELWERSVTIDRAVRTRLRTGTTKADRAVLDALLQRIHDNAVEIDRPGVVGTDPLDAQRPR